MSIGCNDDGENDILDLDEKYGNIFDTLDVMNSSGVMRIVKRSLKRRKARKERSIFKKKKMADDGDINHIKDNDTMVRKSDDVIKCEKDDVKTEQMSRDQTRFFNHGTQTQHHNWLEELVTEHMRKIGSDIVMQESKLSFHKLFQLENENKELRKMIKRWTEQLAALDKKHVDDTDGQNINLPAKGKENNVMEKNTSPQKEANYSSTSDTSPVSVVKMENNTSTQKEAIFSPARATSPVPVVEMENNDEFLETKTASESTPTVEPTVAVDKETDANHSSDTFSIDTRSNYVNENVLLMQEDYPRPTIDAQHTNENVSSNQYYLPQHQQHQELSAQRIPAVIPTQQIPSTRKVQQPPVVHFPQQAPAATMSEHHRRMRHWNLYQEQMQSLNLHLQSLQQREEMLAHQAMQAVTPRLYKEMQEQFQLRYANQQIPSQHPRYQHQRWRAPVHHPTVEERKQQHMQCEPATINLKDYGLQQIKQYADARQLHQRHLNVSVSSTTTENVSVSSSEKLNEEEHIDSTSKTPRRNPPSPSQNMNKENASPPRSVYIIESSSPHSDLYVIKNPSPQKNDEPIDSSSSTLNENNASLTSDRPFGRSPQQIANEFNGDFPPISNRNESNSSSVKRQIADHIIDKANLNRGYPIALQPPLLNQHNPQARYLSAAEKRAIRLKIAVDDVMAKARNEANAAYRNPHEPRSFYRNPLLLPQSRFRQMVDREQRAHLMQLDNALYQHSNVVYNNQAQFKRRNMTDGVSKGNKCRRKEGPMYPQHLRAPMDGQSAQQGNQEPVNGVRQSISTPPLLEPRSNMTLPLLPPRSNVTLPLLPSRSNVTPPLLSPRSNMTPPLLPRQSNNHGQFRYHHSGTPPESFKDSSSYLEYMKLNTQLYQDYRKHVANQSAHSTSNVLSTLQAQNPCLFRALFPSSAVVGENVDNASFVKNQVIDQTNKSDFVSNQVDNVRCIPTPPLSPMSASSHASPNTIHHRPTVNETI